MVLIHNDQVKKNIVKITFVKETCNTPDRKHFLYRETPTLIGSCFCVFLFFSTTQRFFYLSSFDIDLTVKKGRILQSIHKGRKSPFELCSSTCVEASENTLLLRTECILQKDRHKETYSVALNQRTSTFRYFAILYHDGRAQTRLEQDLYSQSKTRTPRKTNNGEKAYFPFIYISITNK